MKRSPLPLRLLSLEDRSLPSSVQGTVFDDANRNQMFDPGESGLSGWNVYVDDNGDRIQNPGEAGAVTGIAGDYFIDVTSLPAGYHELNLDLQVGSGGRWVNSTPTRVSFVTVTEPAAVRDFGVYLQPYASVEPVGSESPVNVTTTGSQSGVAVDSDAVGNYVTAWHSTSGGIDTVFARVFNADGSPRTGEISVATGAGLSAPQVSMADNGRFAVAWSANVPAYGKSSAMTRVYSSTGTALTLAVTVVAATSKLHNYVSGVAMDADGDFAVLVAQYTNVKQGNHWSYSYPLVVQRYTASGTASGKLIQVDDFRNFPQGGVGSIAMSDNGAFVVAWCDIPNGAIDICAQRYTASGQKSGSLITVGGDSSGIEWQPTVSMNSSGQFAISWAFTPDGGFASNIKLARFQANGSPIGSTVVMPGVGATQVAAPNALDDAGNLTVAWPWQGDIHFRRLLADSTLEPELIVNATMQGDQNNPSIAATGTNSFAVAWQGNGPGDDAGIFMQRFEPAGAPRPGFVAFDYFDIPADRDPWE